MNCKASRYFLGRTRPHAPSFLRSSAPENLLKAAPPPHANRLFRIRRRRGKARKKAERGRFGLINALPIQFVGARPTSPRWQITIKALKKSHFQMCKQ